MPRDDVTLDSPSVCTFVNRASAKESTTTVIQSWYTWEEGGQAKSDQTSVCKVAGSSIPPKRKLRYTYIFCDGSMRWVVCVWESAQLMQLSFY